MTPDSLGKFILQKERYIKLLLIIMLVVVTAIVMRPSTITVFNAAYAQSAQASKRKLPIYCVDTADKKISISFDAAWGADDTERLLKILKDNEVKATFFLCGYWVDKYPEEVKRIAEEGHDIGNHGNTHAHGAKLSLEQNKNEIMGVHEKVKNLLGIEINLFRPPFGEYNNTVIEAAEALNYHTIQWDVDSLDWKNYGVEHEVNQVLNHKHLGNGSIVLFHNDATYTPDALDTIIKGIKQKGYEIVPISELIHKENYYMDHEGRQKLK